MTQNDKKLALVSTKGTLDMAYPPFVLASTAAALGYGVAVFFSFYGLLLLRKDLESIRVSPLGNPAMPMPLPVPTMAMALPGMEEIVTRMMKKRIEKKGIASLAELRTICSESGVRFIACDMTMKMFDFEYDEFIDGVEIGGAATFLDFASDADISLFV